ncbi:hypothetical protein EG833_01995 [archaeon]|nr:hypothetical protein [archaeon]
MENVRLHSTKGIGATWYLFLALLLGAGAGTSHAEAEWNVGISGDERGLTGFNLSIGEYYDVPDRDVVITHDRGIYDEELPVVFFLSRYAHVSPEAIVNLRLRGMNWMDITLHFGLGPEIYYVPVTVVHSHPPYGHAYGHYKKYRHHKDWRKIRLRDVDIVNQVNLRFISEHYHYAPEKIMRYREEGGRFPVIERKVWKDHSSGGGERYIYSGQRYRKDNDRNRPDPKRYERSAPQKRSDKVIWQEDRSAPQKREKLSIRKSERTAPQKREMQDVRRIDENTSGDRGGYRSQPRYRDGKKVIPEEKNDKGHDKQGKRDKD